MFRVSSPEYVRACLAAGAASIVSKEEAAPELLRAWRAVVQGERYLPPAVGARLAQTQDDGLTEPAASARVLVGRSISRERSPVLT